MDMEIRLGPKDRVVARLGDRTIATDQDGSAPQPFELFLASIGTCTGFYVSSFCRKRGIEPGAIRIVQRQRTNRKEHRVEAIDVEIVLPAGFPEHYRDALLRSAALCTVKKHLERPPEVNVTLGTRPELAQSV